MAISIEPKKVMNIRVVTAVLSVPDFLTIVRATIVKKWIFFKAQTTASVQNRQVSVLKSKYPRYSESGGMIKQVISASIAAIHRTALCLIKAVVYLSGFFSMFGMVFLLSLKLHRNYITVELSSQ